MHVRALTPVDRAGAAVWAGTAGGAARVALAADALRIERTVDYRDGLPTGPVAALTAREDGAVFLAYNALDARWFSVETSHSAETRAACTLSLPQGPLSSPYGSSRRRAGNYRRHPCYGAVWLDALGRDIGRAFQSRAAYGAQGP